MRTTFMAITATARGRPTLSDDATTKKTSKIKDAGSANTSTTRSAATA